MLSVQTLMNLNHSLTQLLGKLLWLPTFLSPGTSSCPSPPQEGSYHYSHLPPEAHIPAPGTLTMPSTYPLGVLATPVTGFQEVLL